MLGIWPIPSWCLRHLFCTGWKATPTPAATWRCGTASALDYHPRTSDSHIAIGPHHYQDSTPRRSSNSQHQSCNYRALPSACAGQPSRLRYVPLRSVTPDCSGSSRYKALAETHFRPPALASRPLTWKAKVGYVVGTTGSTRGMALARSMAPTTWRSAPLRAIPRRQMATPPRRILAFSLAGFSRCLSRSPANGFRRRLTALPTRSVFAPYWCALNVCQNDKWPPKGASGAAQIHHPSDI